MVLETISNAGKLNIMSEISEIIEDASIHDADECKGMYTAREDRLNSWSHFFGLGLSIIGLILMVAKASTYGSTMNVVACSIFGVALILMYGSSGFYHGTTSKTLKAKLRVMDHMNIYFLIAGTYTPIVLIGLNGPLGWTIFGMMWGLTAFGLLYKLLFFGASWVSSLLYILMGWIAMIFIGQIIAAIPSACFMLIALGGLFYTSGVVFYMLDEVKEYTHFIWHIFVMLGSICQFFAIYFYLADMPIK